jgi:hypothetical protein
MRWVAEPDPPVQALDRIAELSVSQDLERGHHQLAIQQMPTR